MERILVALVSHHPRHGFLSALPTSRLSHPVCFSFSSLDKQQHASFARKPRASHRLTQETLAQSANDHQHPTLRFMQPERPTISQTTITKISPALQNEIPSQHGLPARDFPVSLLPADGDGSREPPTSAERQSAPDIALAASLSEHGEKPRQGGRLSPSLPAFNRIVEYEKASTPPTRKRKGPGFEVIKKHRDPCDKRSPIQELPNGEGSSFSNCA